MAPVPAPNSDILARWVQPQHLSEEALRQHHENLMMHPLRLLVLKDFLRDDAARNLNELFTNEAVYRTEKRLYSSEDRSVDDDEWMRAPDDDRFFIFDMFTAPRPESGLSDNLMLFLRFVGDFSSRPFVEYHGRILGVPVGGVECTVHSMKSGHFLRIHTDDLGKRRFAFVLYLSTDWKSEYGGALHLVDKTKRLTTIQPTFNSLLMFDVTLGTQHFVEPIRPSAADRARVSLGGWFLSPEQVTPE